MKTVNSSTSLRINGERSRTIKFYTVGCKVNQYETQLIREKFLNSGFNEIENNLPSDFYIINTCTVTQRADSDSFSFIRHAKKENPQGKIIVTGCLTELDEDKIKNISEEILIFKNKDKSKIFSLITSNISAEGESAFGRKHQTSNFEGISHLEAHSRAFVKVQDGCDYHCSYCKVRIARGRSISRDIEDIKKEIETLVNNGYKEIVLCGICLGLYGRDLNPKKNLSELISDLEKIPGEFRIRLSSIEAQDIDGDLIEKLKNSEKLCKHLHIPIQSGDDEILEKMNRNFKSSEYRNLIQKLKEEIPDMGITTDIMVGFPGESEENFHNTLNLIKEIKPLRIHIFPFSKREKTPAFYFKPEISHSVIKKRTEILRSLAKELSFEFRKKFLNREVRVLVEETPDKDTGFLKGYTDNYMKILLPTKKELINQLISVKIFKVEENYTFAR